MKKIVSFLGLALLTTWVTVGQFRIDGKVVTGEGMPLPGANVSIDGKTAPAGVNGNFVIDNVSGGNKVLQVSFIGFEPIKEELVVNGNLTRNITLKETSVLANEVTVAAIKAKKNDPMAFSEVSAEELKSMNFGQDLPYLLNLTPGLVVNSDAGAGVGYTSFRLRGSDITRINVTVNGIPLNDSESAGVYWVNMPDFATSVNQVQIQRGVGTSTNGAASFGGSVNFSTLGSPLKNQVIIDNGFGSFNTQRNSVQVSSGLINKRFGFDLRLSRITSDGYIDRGASDLKSFYFSGGYFGDNTTIRFVTFSGKEKTYQSWHGVPKVKLENDRAGMENLVIMDGWSAEEAENLYKANSQTFNRYVYNNQTDNYQQDHYQFHISQKLSDGFYLNGALHYTHGKGYYESYKYNQKFTKYDFPFTEVSVNGVTVKKTDLIAQKWLDNDFYGLTASAIYKKGKVSTVVGGAWNRYIGDHYGFVIWSAVNAGLPKNYRWYLNDGNKTDFNYFAKTTINLSEKYSLYGDLQARHISYEIEGDHDDGTDLSLSTKFNFFNPKIGFNYSFNPGSRFYASVAVANREPTRSDFRDADFGNEPKSEKLTDYETGIEWTGKTWDVQLNIFYMDYKDQLVLTGKINNVGAPITVNVPDSYRKGLELSGQTKLNSWLQWGGNVVLSSNKIKNLTEYVDNWSWDKNDPENADNGPRQYVNRLGTTNIAFSPEITMASWFEAVAFKTLKVTLNSRYVGNQFIDNTSDKSRKIDDYLVNDLILRYTIKTKSKLEIELGSQINNLLNTKYISNAWVYSYVYGGTRGVLDGYFPQAGTHFMGQVLVKF